MPNYTSVDRVLALEPMIGSLSDLSSSQLLTAFIEPAEGEMNSRLSRRYTVPITDTVPLLQAVGDDIATYRILSRRVFTQSKLKDSVWPDRFKESIDTLNEIASGKVLLVNSAGTLIDARSNVHKARSNTDGYLPTFHNGGSWEDQVKDPNQSTDEANERNL